MPCNLPCIYFCCLGAHRLGSCGPKMDGTEMKVENADA